jgi:hypothetical protein
LDRGQLDRFDRGAVVMGAPVSDNDVGVAGEYYWNAGTNQVWPNSNGPYQMQLTGTTVPEPSGLVIFLVLGAAAIARWRRKGRVV